MIHNERAKATRDELLDVEETRHYRRSTIANWHWGKIVLVWGIGAVLFWLGIQIFTMPNPPQMPVIGVLLILGILAVPVTLIGITWRWLSAKDKRS